MVRIAALIVFACAVLPFVRCHSHDNRAEAMKMAQDEAMRRYGAAALLRPAAVTDVGAGRWQEHGELLMPSGPAKQFACTLHVVPLEKDGSNIWAVDSFSITK